MSNVWMATDSSQTFSLDNRLAADCILVGELPLCRLLLLNDTRWPWLVLVPRIDEAIEPFDLSPEQQAQLHHETAVSARALRQISKCEKINIGAIGNIVRQLHVHVIARSEGDANWPGPVWGFGSKISYTDAKARELISSVRTVISAELEIS